MKSFQFLFFLLLIQYSICNIQLKAQITKVKGKVIDAKTKEPIPFVNLAFKGTKIGTSTDFNGYYLIETYQPSDSLLVSSVGYLKAAKSVTRHKSQTINFELNTTKVQLTEVIIKYTGNPAHALLKKIIANKGINNYEKFDAYQYEVYNKIEFDLNNITEKFKNKRVFRPFKFIFDNIDTSDINGKTYLPIFMIESISDFYYRKNPKNQKEVIKASKVSGVNNKSVSQFLGQMYQNMNLYDNYIVVINKGFISPIADFGMMFYKYYLTDSAFIDNNWCYKIMFMPRRKQELTFNGHFWVHDTTFAIAAVDMRIEKTANVNFIKDMIASQKFKRIDDKRWMPEKSKVFVDFILSDNARGFFGRKTATYKNHIINQVKEDSFYSMAENIIIHDDATEKSEEYWDTARHEPLSKNERAIYTMIDSIQKIPVYNTYIDLIVMFATGYKVWGKFELGPYYTLYSFNKIEGSRFRFGGRTSNAFSKRLMIESYIAYGIRDGKFKGGGGFEYFLAKKRPRHSIGVFYTNDLEQLGQSENAFREDNILASVFRRIPLQKLTRFEELSTFYQREWFDGFSNKLSYVHRVITPPGDTSFAVNPGDGTDIYDNITTSEIRFNTRFAYNEKFVSGEFNRTSFGTKYPVITVQYIYGINNFWDSAFEFHKIYLTVKDRVRINPFGYLDYIFDAGKIFGKLPYQLLELHTGNETYSYDDYAFNMMNYFEFASDQYISFSVTHHFDGLFLDKIPLFKKLKWREVLSAKSVWGSLDDKHKEVISFPVNLTKLKKPYVEAGVGVENILKVLRVDALWRLAYLKNPDITKFGIRVKFQIKF